MLAALQYCCIWNGACMSYRPRRIKQLELELEPARPAVVTAAATAAVTAVGLLHLGPAWSVAPMPHTRQPTPMHLECSSESMDERRFVSEMNLDFNPYDSCFRIQYASDKAQPT
ncbi:hypothetical protein AWZ03_013990 [Drosophila navojoa]|uniref:Uncharacterized protein n=1 Tax=Drosophila navojoa TaxID=7232 RepID=A0A484ASM0_DRONA|nr:hypothetical protein AWZ03_013990 [Drosophila navojoa]